MLLLKFSATLLDVGLHWTNFFYGTISVFLLIVIIFMYIDKGNSARQNVSGSPQTSILARLRAKWQRFKAYLGVSEKTNDDEIEEYKDNYGKYSLVSAILVVAILVYCISRFDWSININFSLPDWLSVWLHSPWFYLIIILIILFVIFRKSIRKKLPTNVTERTKKIKWGWVIFWIVIILWAMPRYIIPFCQYLVTPSIRVESKKVEKKPGKFNLTGENPMEIGEPYEFYQDDGKTWEFEPKDYGKIVYRVIKLENTTRDWTIERRKDSTGTDRLCLNKDQIEPNDAAKRGRAIIILQSYVGSNVVIAKRRD